MQSSIFQKTGQMINSIPEDLEVQDKGLKSL